MSSAFSKQPLKKKNNKKIKINNTRFFFPFCDIKKFTLFSPKKKIRRILDKQTFPKICPRFFGWKKDRICREKSLVYSIYPSGTDENRKTFKNRRRVYYKPKPNPLIPDSTPAQLGERTQSIEPGSM
jgi:hypothetical protein